jgi:hypothetical protein
MKQFTQTIMMSVGAQAMWHGMKVEVDGIEKDMHIVSKDWSDIGHMENEYCAKVPNNNAFSLHT